MSGDPLPFERPAHTISDAVEDRLRDFARLATAEDKLKAIVLEARATSDDVGEIKLQHIDATRHLGVLAHNVGRLANEATIDRLRLGRLEKKLDELHVDVRALLKRGGNGHG